MRHVSLSPSKSVSPRIFPSTSVKPTSIIVAPGRTMSVFRSPGHPAATIIMSAFFVNSLRFFVSLWQTVTVHPAFMRRRARGFPTILLFPITTIFSPVILISDSVNNFITPFGVQEIRSAVPRKSFPIFWLVKPSTSFLGSIASITEATLICFGRGSCTMNQLTLLSLLSE